jgi:hypothetical protein
VYYPDALGAAEQYADQLAGKVVVDITNPVNESFDGLVVPPDGSATEELAALAGGARWVKAFNTTFAIPLKSGTVAGDKLDVLLAESRTSSAAVSQAPSRSSPDGGFTAGGRAGSSHMSEDQGVGQGCHGRERGAPGTMLTL